MNISVKFGLISGAIIILLYVIFYSINTLYYFEFGLSLVTYLINLIFMFLAVHQVKKIEMGEISFSRALSTSFIVVVISNFLFIVFDYVMKVYINTQMTTLQIEHSIDTALRMAEMVGAKLSETEKEEMYTALDGYDEAPSILFTIIAYFQTLFKGFIGALLVALIMKNERKIQF